MFEVEKFPQIRMIRPWDESMLELRLTTLGRDAPLGHCFDALFFAEPASTSAASALASRSRCLGSFTDELADCCADSFVEALFEEDYRGIAVWNLDIETGIGIARAEHLPKFSRLTSSRAAQEILPRFSSLQDHVEERRDVRLRRHLVHVAEELVHKRM